MECCNSEVGICSNVRSDGELFMTDTTCEIFEISVLLEEALDLIEEEGGDPDSVYGQALLCNVETLLKIALVDVQGAAYGGSRDINAYAIDRALSQLSCSQGGLIRQLGLCDKLFEVKHVIDQGNDEV